MLTFFSDTDCDITPKECAAYNIKLISMPYTVGEQVIYPYIDFDEFDSHKFYDMLRAGTMPTTSAMSEEAYTQYFEPEFAAGNDILYVHFSSGTSNTFTIMHQALEKLKAKYPVRKFYEVDNADPDTNIINVKYGNGLSLDNNNALRVNVGDGLEIDANNNIKVDISRTTIFFNNNPNS